MIYIFFIYLIVVVYKLYNFYIKYFYIDKNYKKKFYKILINYNLYLNSFQFYNFIYHTFKNGSSCLIIKDGKKYSLNKILYDSVSITSRISVNGPIVKYIIKLSKLNPELNIIIPFTDSDPFLKNTFNLYNIDDVRKHINYKKFYDYNSIFKDNFIILLGNNFKNFILNDECKKIPFSDKLYSEINYKKINDELFKNKINKIIWRGSTTGGKYFSLRNDVVNYLKYNINCDVNFTNKINRLSINEMSKYKAILLIDGKAHPSSIDWIYISGSLPIRISCWNTCLDDILIPWQDYIPVKTDLSDLDEVINFVLNEKNNNFCQKIINNGYHKFKNFANKNNVEKIIKDCILK